MFTQVQTLAKTCVIALACSVAPAQATYWNLFNIEGESAQGARYVTYSSLADMLGDTNRLGVFDPNGGGASFNVVGSGSDERAGGVVPVPEPSTLMLTGVAILASVLQRPRKRTTSTGR